MIRTSDRKPAPPAPACHDEAAHPAFGIAFEKRDGTKRFVPYALLSALDFDGTGELTFCFTSGAVNVHGITVEALWKAACKGELARVWESEQPPDSKTAWVREVAFSEIESEPETNPNVPPFPREASPN